MCPDRTSNRQDHALSIHRVLRTPRRGLWLTLIMVAGVSGCGNVAGDAFFNAATAAGTSFLDQLLTAAVNGTLDLLNPPPPADTQPVDGSSGAGNFDGLTGSAANGLAFFTANSCASCHCDDAGGGCALSAPSLVGVDVIAVDDRLRGTKSHSGGKFELTDQEIVDLVAFLASP